jgi:hypothetical protein
MQLRIRKTYDKPMLVKRDPIPLIVALGTDV